MNLDRFSYPLETERDREIDPVFLDWQRQEIKEDIIRRFIYTFQDLNGSLPEAETVQESLKDLDADLSLIEEIKKNLL